jgi:hypothetical protein
MFEKRMRSVELVVIMSFTSIKSNSVVDNSACDQTTRIHRHKHNSKIQYDWRQRVTELPVMSTSSSTSLRLAAHQPWYLATPLPRSEDYGMACLRQWVACARTFSTRMWSVESVGEQREHCAPLHCVAWQMSRKQCDKYGSVVNIAWATTGWHFSERRNFFT